METADKSSEEQTLVATALDEYRTGKYTECKATLELLTAMRPNDWKVSMNKIVVAYLSSGEENTQSLHDQISSLFAQFNFNVLESESLEDVDHSSLAYNQAVVLFRQKKFQDSLVVIDKIFPHIHEMEGHLGRKVCTLLLDLNVHLGDYEKAMTNLLAIEKQYDFLNAVPVLGDESKTDPSGTATDSSQLQQFKTVLLEYKARIHLALGNYEVCKETVDAFLSSGCLNYSTSMIKAKLCILTNHYEEALNVLHLFMQNIEDFVQLAPEKKIIFYNNLAITNYLLKKYHSSSFYTCKSLLAFQDGVDKDGKNSYFCSAKLLKLTYNRGVSLLFKGEPAKAFDCLLEVAQKMFTSAVLWLRLAECCIRINKPGNQETFNLTEKRKDLVQGVCRNKNSSNIIMNNKIYRDSNYNCEPQSYAVPMPTMEFASICGRNALLLLPKETSKLKLGVLAANTYIRLSIGDPVLALKYANSLFLESNSSPLYKYLGRLYMSEAYLDLNQLDKAIQALDPTTHKECDPMAENSEADFLPNSQSAGQSVLLYNLAVALVIRKDLDKASELLKHVWVSRGTDRQIPVHVLSLALYIELVQGRVDVAKTIIKQNCPHVFY